VGSVSVISKGFLEVLFGGSVLLWLAVWRVRRCGRIAVGLCSLAAMLLTLVAAADGVNAHYQYLPRVSDVIGARDWPTISKAQWVNVSSRSTIPSAAPVAVAANQGAVVTLNIGEQRVGFSATKALVYLPPQYFANPTQRFPVVYLLHGSPGMPVDWLRGGGAAHAGYLAARAGHPQILVMPHLSRDWLDDSECVDGAHMLVETYVVHDLVPSIDAQLRTEADRGHRAVAGMSAGGYCALNLGLRHRDLFGVIVDMSGYTHPSHSGGMPSLFGRQPDLRDLVAANSPDVYVDSLPAAPSTRVFLVCGTSDHVALKQLASLRDRLRGRGFDVTWTTRPGGHTYGVWRPGLVNALNWTFTAG
jgi:enterochelin esterase-like enzyme